MDIKRGVKEEFYCDHKKVNKYKKFHYRNYNLRGSGSVTWISFFITLTIKRKSYISSDSNKRFELLNCLLQSFRERNFTRIEPCIKQNNHISLVSNKRFNCQPMECYNHFEKRLRQEKSLSYRKIIKISVVVFFLNEDETMGGNKIIKN